MRIPPELNGEQKQQVILSYGKEYGFKTLIETGTYDGDMIEATKGVFGKVYSIELMDDFYNRAINRFKDDSNVEILHGNSGELIKKIMVDVKESTLFWLDAHDGQSSPVISEIDAILSCEDFDHILLIDDMRNFEIGRKFYPKQQAIRDAILKYRPNWKIDIVKDIMRAGINIKV